MFPCVCKAWTHLHFLTLICNRHWETVRWYYILRHLKKTKKTDLRTTVPRTVFISRGQESYHSMLFIWIGWRIELQLFFTMEVALWVWNAKPEIQLTIFPCVLHIPHVSIDIIDHRWQILDILRFWSQNRCRWCVCVYLGDRIFILSASNTIWIDWYFRYIKTSGFLVTDLQK